MGFLKNAIRKGLSEAVSNAIEKVVEEKLEPKATELANMAADRIDAATQSAATQMKEAEEAARPAGGWESALSSLQSSLESYATQASKNMKVCPKCGRPTSADKKFCPECGTELPDETLAQGAVCPSCGKQNTIGTKFCTDCGSKLPAALAEEQAAADRDAAVMAEWDEKLAAYPKWNCGGTEFHIEEYEPGIFGFSACFNGDSEAASRSVEQYLQLARQHGFHPAGEHPGDRTIYNKIDGTCYCIDTTDCLAGDPDSPIISLCIREPYGGYDYVKPEPKKVSLRDLFNF